MQITVTIPDEVAAQIEARGLTPEGYIMSLIDGADRTALTALLWVTRKPRNMKEFFREMAAHSDKIPQLPDEAFARDSFYQDHD